MKSSSSESSSPLAEASLVVVVGDRGPCKIEVVMDEIAGDAAILIICLNVSTAMRKSYGQERYFGSILGRSLGFWLASVR